MLATIGFDSFEGLVKSTVPENILMDQPLNLDPAMSESEAIAKIKSYASKNQVMKSYIGQGYYDTQVPKVILRNMLENPGWYTAYTPYQAEISQGRLEMLLNQANFIIGMIESATRTNLFLTPSQLTLPMMANMSSPPTGMPSIRKFSHRDRVTILRPALLVQ